MARVVRNAAFMVAALSLVCARSARADGGYLGIYLTDENVATRGAYVEDVAPKSPAEESGIHRGDLITSVNGTKTPNSHDLIAILVTVSPNDTLKIQLSRDGWEKDLSVKLGSRGESKRPEPKTETPKAPEGGERGFLGAFLKANPEGPGAFVDGVVADSPAAKVLLKKGDIVTSVNGKAIKDYTELQEILKASKPGQKLALRVSREGWDRDVSVELGHKTAERTAPPPVKPADPGPVKEPPKTKKPAFMGVSIVDADGKGPLKVDDVQPQSPAEKSGIKPGDTILIVGGKKVNTVKDFEDVMRGHFAGEEIMVHLEREGWGRDVKVMLGERSDKD
ncbi:PDZ domain-containing protein [bacterium]|nr:PDZ domain-containing protein [bacterium]